MVRSGGSARFSDAALAIFVIAIAVMLLIPLPTIALDLLLTLSIAFSVLLLLVGLYIPNALSLLAFPSLLLLTTLFRLSLNVASTRLILSDGDAGQVIEAFGTFLIRGEVVVGIIIFVIVTVVNFIVIARGAGRVSEVAARFALDALPGKQMAIDSDLRAGIINAQEAQQKRELLRQESQLYGAMDGAMKFVQGDAVAGLFITCTNIVGGMYMGIAQGMTVQQAVQTYTTLTVGDGLVSQIPALLVSICAGIVVTRVAASDRSTLGRELGAQLFKRPALLFLTGVILLIVMALSDLPWFPFLTIIVMCFVGAYYISNKSSAVPLEYAGRPEQFPVGRLGAPQDALELPRSGAVIEISLDQAVLYQLYERRAGQYQEWWRTYQRDFFGATGLQLPDVSIVKDPYLGSGSYHVRLGDASIERGGVLLDSVMVEMNPHCASVFGLRVLRKEEHPLRGEQVFWTRANLSSLEILRAADIRYFDFFEYISLRLGRYLRSNPEEVLSLIDIHAKLKELEKQYPGFVSDALFARGLNATRVAEVIHAVVRSGLSVKDFKATLEAIASFVVDKGAKAEILVVSEIVSHVRYMRRRQLINGSLSARDTVKVCTLGDLVDEAFEELDEGPVGASLPLAPLTFDSLEQGLDLIVSPFKERGILPITILCRREIRNAVQKFLSECSISLPVLSYEELEAGALIESVGVWDIDARSVV